MDKTQIEPCHMMVFQGPPYPEEKMGESHQRGLGGNRSVQPHYLRLAVGG